MAGRPDLMGGRTSLTVYAGMTGMMENAFINVKNRSKTHYCRRRYRSGSRQWRHPRPRWPLRRLEPLCQGWQAGLHVQLGRAATLHNCIRVPLPSGKSTIRLDFAYDGGGRGKGGTATLFVNGQKVAEGRVSNTNANLFSADEGADVGMDEDTPVTEAYQAGIASRFTGKIDKVTIEVK